MRAPRFYLPSPLAVGEVITLSESAFRHAVTVLRLVQGAPITLFNGAGGEYAALLEPGAKRTARARITHYHAREVESPLLITLAQAVARGERMDTILQKSVELGVARIAPISSERSAVELPDGRLRKRLQHWRAVVSAACEQCGRNRLPEVLEPMPLGEWLAAGPAAGWQIVLDPQAKQGLGALGVQPPAAISLLIGPEGGLTATELEQARQAGFTARRLGPRVLRTETAGMAALAALQALWGDLAG